MRQAGLVTGNRSFYPEKDVWIRVVLDPYAGDKIYISADEAPVVLNAFVDTYKKVDLKDNGRPKYQYLVDAQNTSEHRVPSVPPPVPPATNPPISLHAVRLKATPADLVNTTWLPVEPQTSVTQDEKGDKLPTFPNQSTNKWREVFESFLPSKFTGHIRKTMQVAHAEGRWLDPLKVEVDYHYGNCFGLVKQNKKYYMLWIQDTSVWYVPASISVTTDKDGNEIPRLDSMSKTSAVKIKDFAHDGTSWSTEIGWAFSYDKPEAAIVMNGSIMQGTSSYQSVSLATLTFTFDVTTGIPNGATFVQTTPKIFWNHHFMTDEVPGVSDWGLFNIPVFKSIDGIQPKTLHNETVNFGRGRPAGMGPNQMPSGYSANAIPVYVFYSETKGQQLCTYSYEVVLSQAETFTFTPTVEAIGINGGTSYGYYNNYKELISKGWQGTKLVSSYVNYGFSLNGSSIQKGRGSTTGSSYTSYGISDSYNAYGGSVESVASVLSYHYGFPDGHGNGVPFPPGTPITFVINHSGYGYIVEVQAAVTSSSGGDVVVDSSLTLSVLDRESLLIYSSKATAESTITETFSTSAYSVVRDSEPCKTSMIFSPSVAFGDYASEGGTPQFIAYLNWYWFFGGSMYGSLTTAGYDGCVLRRMPWIASSEVWIPAGAGSFFKYSEQPWTLQSWGWYDINSSVTHSQTANPPPRTMNTPASTTQTLTLFTGRDPITIDPARFQVNSVLFTVYPGPGSNRFFAYKATQAAWNPKYVAYDIAPGTQNVSVVDMNGTKYNVENQLFGWIGAV